MFEDAFKLFKLGRCEVGVGRRNDLEVVSSIARGRCTHRVLDERNFLLQTSGHELQFPFEILKCHHRVVILFDVGFQTRLIDTGDFGVEDDL